MVTPSVVVVVVRVTGCGSWRRVRPRLARRSSGRLGGVAADRCDDLVDGAHGCGRAVLVLEEAYVGRVDDLVDAPGGQCGELVLGAAQPPVFCRLSEAVRTASGRSPKRGERLRLA